LEANVQRVIAYEIATGQAQTYQESSEPMELFDSFIEMPPVEPYQESSEPTELYNSFLEMLPCRPQGGLFEHDLSQSSMLPASSMLLDPTQSSMLLASSMRLDPFQTTMTYSQLYLPQFSGQQGPQGPPLPQPPEPRKKYGNVRFIPKPDTFGDYALWDANEVAEGRRIVRFHGEKNGNLMTVSCCPIASQDYTEDMHTISCVYFHPNEQGQLQHPYANQCVFTSVDVIKLIGKLVDDPNADDVREKNRIRRNLEGLRPRTIKKEGSTNQFFNQLMGYSKPKTRNIEKDIKVFLWRDLTKALRKIIRQYVVNDDNDEATSSYPPAQFLPQTQSGIDPGTLVLEDFGEPTTGLQLFNGQTNNTFDSSFVEPQMTEEGSGRPTPFIECSQTLEEMGYTEDCGYDAFLQDDTGGEKGLCMPSDR
jgi:hypothetical protein